MGIKQVLNKNFETYFLIGYGFHPGVFIMDAGTDDPEDNEDECLPAIVLSLEMMCAAHCLSTDKCLGFVFHEEAKQCYLKTFAGEQEQSGNCDQHMASRWSKGK